MDIAQSISEDTPFKYEDFQESTGGTNVSKLKDYLICCYTVQVAMYYLFSFSLLHFLSKEMRQHLAHSMLEIANKEKQHATVINRFQQGVPSITVVVNGGWSK